MSSFVMDGAREWGDTLSQLRVWEALHALATRLGTNPLTGQSAVIVGASSGLGLELARQLAQAGCKLAICAREPDELERVRRELVHFGVAVFARALDATDSAQVESFVGATLRRFGSLDMLITSACALEPRSAQEALEQVFWAAYHPTMAVLPHMRARRAGRIVHVSARDPRLGLTPQCTANAAWTGFCENLRDELAHNGISVTAALTSPGSERAARRILHAAMHGKPEITLGTRLRAVAGAVTRNLLAQTGRDPIVPAASAPCTSEAFRRSDTASYHACPPLRPSTLTTETTSILRAS